jgi:hypothetical protein
VGQIGTLPGKWQRQNFEFLISSLWAVIYTGNDNKLALFSFIVPKLTSFKMICIETAKKY